MRRRAVSTTARADATSFCQTSQAATAIRDSADMVLNKIRRAGKRLNRAIFATSSHKITFGREDVVTFLQLADRSQRGTTTFGRNCARVALSEARPP
jgi:hypothetical protein